jgi:hypothetical protein
MPKNHRRRYPIVVRTQGKYSDPNTAFKAATLYGLRLVGSEKYIDPRAIKKLVSVNGRPEIVILPKTSEEVILNQSKVLVDLAWRTWQAYHLHSGEGKPLEMVEFQTGFVSSKVLDLEVDPLVLRAITIGSYYGAEARTAFEMAIQRGEANEYRYLLRRRGGKAVVDELMPDNFSYGSLTFLRDDTELFQARIILGDTKPAIYFDLVEFPAPCDA